MPYCPKCGYEYKPGLDKCPDCNEFLVDSKPILAEEVGPVRNMPDSDWIKLARLQSRMQAELVVEGLRAKNIPAMLYSTAGHYGLLGDSSQYVPAPYEGGFFIMVPLEFADDADQEAALMLGEIWEKSKLPGIQE